MTQTADPKNSTPGGDEQHRPRDRWDDVDFTVYSISGDDLLKMKLPKHIADQIDVEEWIADIKRERRKNML